MVQGQDLDASLLIFELHGLSMRALSNALATHMDGLSALARTGRKKGIVSNRMSRKLVKIDEAFGLLRHITRSSLQQVLAELRGEITSARLVKDDIDDIAPASVAPLPAAALPQDSVVEDYYIGSSAPSTNGDDVAAHDSSPPPSSSTSCQFETNKQNIFDGGSENEKISDIGFDSDFGFSQDLDDFVHGDYCDFSDGLGPAVAGPMPPDVPSPQVAVPVSLTLEGTSHASGDVTQERRLLHHVEVDVPVYSSEVQAFLADMQTLRNDIKATSLLTAASGSAIEGQKTRFADAMCRADV